MTDEIQTSICAEIDDSRLRGVSIWGTLEEYRRVVRAVRESTGVIRIQLDRPEHAPNTLEALEFCRGGDGPVKIRLQERTLVCEGAPDSLARFMIAIEAIENSVVLGPEDVGLIDKIQGLIYEGTPDSKAELMDVLESIRGREVVDPLRSESLPHLHIEYWGDGQPDYLHADCIPLTVYRIQR